MQARTVLVAVLAVQALLLSACTVQAAESLAGASAADTPQTTGIVAPQTMDIVMREHSFEPATIRLKSGQAVRLLVRNEGLIAHAMMIGRELERLTWGPGERPREDFFGGVDLSQSIKYGAIDRSRATEVTLYPGGSASLIFTVPADRTGEWEIGCLIPGHYESGMRGTLTVE